MGGGITRRPEVAKHLDARRADGNGGGGVGQPDLEQAICEREQAVSFRVKGDVEVGDRIRVVLGDPLDVIVNGRAVGRLTDARQAATLTACINENYRIVGEVVRISDVGEAHAVVVGVR
jgi:hypothetical protein